MTFDERNNDQNHKRSASMYSSFDQTRLKKQNTLRNNSSFGFGSSFHFRRTVSKVPSFMRRQKMSIANNVEQIRRKSSLENIITCRICMIQIAEI